MVSRMQARRDSAEPIEHILGGTVFCGEWFIVTKDVLIPRAETEMLVDFVMNALCSMPYAPRVLDLGIGSGCIAVMLAKKLNCHVVAVDISDKALNVAKQNAKMHGVSEKIEFIKSDWYEGLEIERVDIIVSNPPYIAEEEWGEIPEEVKQYEPKSALLAGEKGLDCYKAIISGAIKHLVPGGRIVLEIGYKQADLVKGLLKETFKDMEVIKDQYGNDRVVSAWIN